MGGPQRVFRETCEHCQYKNIPNGCKGCLAGIAYECEDERRAKIYYTEVSHLKENFRSSCARRREREIKNR